MKKHMLKIIGLSLLSAAIAAAPSQAMAQEKAKPAAEKKEGAKAERATPFHGKITAVDKTAKTLTVGERVFQVTSETKIKKGGQSATLDDAAVGDEVGGSYMKGADGKLNARSVRIGPKAEGEAKGEGKKKKSE